MGGGPWGGLHTPLTPPLAPPPPQYLNIKLTDISVTDPEKYPHMVRGFGGLWGALGGSGIWGGVWGCSGVSGVPPSPN